MKPAAAAESRGAARPSHRNVSKRRCYFRQWGKRSFDAHRAQPLAPAAGTPTDTRQCERPSSGRSGVLPATNSIVLPWCGSPHCYLKMQKQFVRTQSQAVSEKGKTRGVGRLVLHDRQHLRLLLLLSSFPGAIFNTPKAFFDIHWWYWFSNSVKKAIFSLITHFMMGIWTISNTSCNI